MDCTPNLLNFTSLVKNYKDTDIIHKIFIYRTKNISIHIKYHANNDT